MGKPIIEHQGVAFMLADMAINVEAARGLVWKSAWAKDAGEKNSRSRSPAELTSSFLCVHGQGFR
jgi:acyl-CoA dehydrogenase